MEQAGFVGGAEAAGGALVPVSAPDIPPRLAVGAPARFSVTDEVGIRRLTPTLGQDEDHVFGELLGLSRAQRDDLGRITASGHSAGGHLALWLAARFAQTMGLSWTEALWQGAFHSVSAYNNAGFSTWPDSVMRHVTDGWVLAPLMLAIVVGGLGFPVITELWANRRKRHARWSIHTTLTVWGSATLVVLGTLALWLVEHNNPRTLGTLGFLDQWQAALFTSVSARTAGFNAVDIGALELESLVLHYVLMFIGGGSAGTAGGVKVTTVFLLLLIVWSEIRGRADVELRGRRIGTQVQRQALSILVLSGAAVSLGLLVIIPMAEHLPLEKLMFEVVSAFATVGLSTGITAELPPGAQGVIIALMYAGRVGVVTLALALAINQVPRAYRYPEEKPIVG